MDQGVFYDVYVSPVNTKSSSPCAMERNDVRLEGDDVIYWDDFMHISTEAMESMIPEDVDQRYMYVSLVANMPGARDAIAFTPFKVMLPSADFSSIFRCKPLISSGMDCSRSDVHFVSMCHLLCMQVL